MSSHDRHLRVHEVVHRSAAERRRLLAGERAVPAPAGAAAASTATLPFSRHWWITSRTCVASTQPATSTEPSATTCASVPSTGPVVITGEQIRTRRRASRMRFAICAREILAVTGREPGAHARRASADRRSRCASTSPRLPQLLEVERERRRDRLVVRRRRPRSPAASTSRRSSSASRSRRSLLVADDVLVVHQVGDAGDRPSLDGEGRDQQHVGLGRRRHRDRVRVVDVVGEAHAHAARRPRAGSRRRRSRRSPRRARSRTARGRANARAPSMNAATSRAISPGCWPPSVRVRICDALAHRSSASLPASGDHELLPRRRRAPRCGATALAAYLERAGRRADPARRRGAGLPRRARLGHAVHLRAPADRRRARPRRPPRSCTASSPSSARRRASCSGTSSRRTRAPRRSNRAPSRGEVAAGRAFARELARGRRVIAVGRSPPTALGAPYVRHPSHGGARRRSRQALRCC